MKIPENLITKLCGLTTDPGGRGTPDLDQDIHAALGRLKRPPEFVTSFRRPFPYTSSKTSALRLFEILPTQVAERTQRMGEATLTTPARAVFWWIDISHEYPAIQADSITLKLSGGPKGTTEATITVPAAKEALAITFLILSAFNAVTAV